MQVNVKTNIKEISKNLTRDQKKQVPFAASLAINATLGIGKKNRMKGLDGALQKQMKKKLDNPMPRTTKAFYRVGSRKTNLVGVLGFTEWASKFMRFLIEGGTRFPKKSKIGVPYKNNARLNRYGNIAGRKSGLIKKQSQFIAKIAGIDGVWERQKRDKKAKLIIGFKNSVLYKPIFPFYKIAKRYCLAKFDENFQKALDKAIKSAK